VDELRALARVSDRGSRILRRTMVFTACRMPDRPRDLSIDARRPMIFVIPWREFSLVGH
jgi:hypothetical protein